MSMFSFQAIHNMLQRYEECARVVYRLCQCSLFKQFTTVCQIGCQQFWLFIDYVNVLFSSNSQLATIQTRLTSGCLSIMSMFSFQAIHNIEFIVCPVDVLFIDYVNVLFSSNSQRNKQTLRPHEVVYRLCQCSLFKQFTTNHLVLFFDAKVRFFSDSAKFIFQGVEK